MFKACVADQARIDVTCYSLAVGSAQPCLNGGSCKPSRREPRAYQCICRPTYSGNNCDFHVMPTRLGAGAIAGIVLGVLGVIVLVGLLIGFFVWRRCRNAREELLPRDEDLRENVMPYFEGAGEADTRNFDLRKLDPTYVYMPRQSGWTIDPNTPAVLPQTPDLMQPYVGTVTNTFQNLADKSRLGQLLTERIHRVLEEPTGPPPDYTLDYGYEGGVSDDEEDPHEADEEEEGVPSDLVSLTPGPQSRASVGEDNRGQDSRGNGTLCRAFDELDRLPDPDSSNPHLRIPPSLPPQPPTPQQQEHPNTGF